MSPTLSTPEELRASYERIWSTTDMFETRDYYARCLDLAGPSTGERVLDVACGAGYFLQEAERRGLATSGIDIADAALARARTFAPKTAFHRGDAEAMPYADGSFDIVTCLGSLEHFIRPAAALEEMRRVLAPGGRAVIAIPNQFWAYDIARGWLEGAPLKHGQDSEDFFSLGQARDLMNGSFSIVREWPWNPPISHMRATRPFTGRWASWAFRVYGWLRPRLPFVASYLFVFVLEKAPGEAPREVAPAGGGPAVIPGGWHPPEADSRWSTARAGVWLRLGSRIRAEALHDEPAGEVTGRATVAAPLAVSIAVERTQIGAGTLIPHVWGEIAADVPAALRGTVQRVYLEPARTWSPGDHGVRDDLRTLGVSVRRIWTE